MVVDERLSVKCDRTVNQLADGGVTQAIEQLVFERAPVAPGNDCTSVGKKSLFNGRSRLGVVVSDNGGTISEATK